MRILAKLPLLAFALPLLLPVPRAAAQTDTPVAAATGRNPAEIEKDSGGRLGIALVDKAGNLILGFNRDERHAMCSTFKAPLAAAVLIDADAGRIALDQRIPFTEADVLEYAPVVRAAFDGTNKTLEEWATSPAAPEAAVPLAPSLTVEELLAAAVKVSDNSAANLLLPLVGGPEGLTAFFRRHGDTVSRLDRTETALNENAQNDERDTTTPAAMAKLMARLMFGDMPGTAALKLRGWMEASTSGANRIRAGLQPGWTAADKTGTCGNAISDVGVLRSPTGQDYVIALYLDRPVGSAELADKALADATASALSMLETYDKRNQWKPPTEVGR